MLSRQFMPSTRPCSLRLSGTSEMPLGDRVGRRGDRTSSPSSRIAPARRLRAGRTGSRRSRSAPRRQGRRSPHLARAHLETDVPEELAAGQALDLSGRSPSSRVRAFRLRSSLRPIIICVISSSFVSAVVSVPRYEPSRSTLIRSVILKISSIRCEM
jgi:hypothetical protein